MAGKGELGENCEAVANVDSNLRNTSRLSQAMNRLPPNMREKWSLHNAKINQ